MMMMGCQQSCLVLLMRIRHTLPQGPIYSFEITIYHFDVIGSAYCRFYEISVSYLIVIWFAGKVSIWYLVISANQIISVSEYLAQSESIYLGIWFKIPVSDNVWCTAAPVNNGILKQLEYTPP